MAWKTLQAARVRSGQVSRGLVPLDWPLPLPDEFPAILQKGETVLPKNTKMGGNNITFNITTPNAQSFMESQGQIMSKLAAQMGRHKARNG